MLSQFIHQEPDTRSRVSDALEALLAEVMCAVNVRRLDSVDPEGIRELLRSTFDVMKVRHLHEHGVLTTAQLKQRLEVARNRIA